MQRMWYFKEHGNNIEFRQFFIDRISKKQKEIMTYKPKFGKPNKYNAKKVREVAKELGLNSTNFARTLLKKLKTKGYITIDQKKSRGIKLNGSI